MLLTFLCLVLGVFIVRANATAIEYVSRDQAQSLADEFSKAEPIDENFIKKIAGKNLNCDMFGMRSRLQVERNVKLYRFLASGGGFKNSGAQVVSSYEVSAGRLMGRRGHLVDEVRNSQGHLLAQLALSPEGATAADRGLVVLAYSRCKL